MDGFASYQSLKGRTVFITGGATGIGAAFVRTFHDQGARVAFGLTCERSSRAACRRLQSSVQCTRLALGAGGTT